MRSFNNWSNVRVVTPNITLTVSANDGSETFIFTRNEILDIGDIVWEIPFTGGLVKSANYDIDLSMEVESIKNIVPKLVGAVAELQVEINSNVFYPHLGRIRSYERNGLDLNRIQIKVFDKFFDDKQFFPKELITDSWSTPHLEELLSGYPVYYGKHTRPFYHTAVTCDVDILLGPRNVSSENHVNSVFFNSDLDKGLSTSLQNVILMGKSWVQQNCSNVISGGEPFEIIDAEPLEVKYWKYNDTFFPITNVHCNLEITSNDKGVLSGQAEYVGNEPLPSKANIRPFLEKNIPQEIHNTTKFNYCLTFFDLANPTINGFVGVSSIDTTINETLFTALNSITGVGSLNVSSSNGRFLFTDNKNVYLNYSQGNSDFPSTFACSVAMGAQLKSEGYLKHSIFSPIVESSDIAISENPQLIIEDIFSNHLAIGFVQSQASATQVDVQSYNFQCFFKERQEITDILDDFGRITQVNMWIGDSGEVNFRHFKDNPTINNSLGISNVIDFSIREAPIGSSITEQDLASKIKVKYNYDFQRNLFQNTKVADKNNTAECESLDNIGFRKEKTFETEYILELDTASYFTGNMVRKFAQGGEFITFTSGPELLDMEIGDCFNMEHAAIVGSNANYQIIRLSANYIKGSTKITAAKLNS